MKKLFKHELKYGKALDYFKSYLENRHELSMSILKYNNFNKGTFFTLLPKEANFKRISYFEYGGILPSNPEEEIYISSLNKTFIGEWINNIDKEVAKYIYLKLKSDITFSCIMEDLLQITSDPHIDLFYKIGFKYYNRIFYLISHDNFSQKLINNALKESQAPRHFVGGIFTNNSINLKNSKIKKREFINIVNNLEIIIIDAYDGEGYIFWEREKSR